MKVAGVWKYVYRAVDDDSAVDTVPTTTASYLYDGMGRRVVKNVDGVITQYLYDNEDILLELDVDGNVIARYTHGPGIDEPLIMQRDTDADGTLDASYFFVSDGLGSVVKLVDTSGNVVNSYVYDSFGNMMERTEAVPNFYTYTGREFDSESGLYYYRTRYYNANIGRFISEDPICFDGGNNFYIYVQNNSINRTDPNGLYGTSDCSYYYKKCKETKLSYYCTYATFYCEIFPNDPTSNCVRKCLQDYSEGKCSCMGELDTYLCQVEAHSYCFYRCLGRHLFDLW